MTHWRHLYILIVISFGILSCASTPKGEAQSVYSDYLKACNRGDEAAAQNYLLRPNAEVEACPDSQEKLEALKAAKKANIVITAQNSGALFVQTEGGFQIDPGSAFAPNSLSNQLRSIKYAIKNADVPALSELIHSSSRPSDDVLQQWIVSSEAQDIYAAAATNPNAWFQIQGNSAMCQISGIVLDFEVDNGIWRWVFKGNQN